MICLIAAENLMNQLLGAGSSFLLHRCSWAGERKLGLAILRHLDDCFGNLQPPSLGVRCNSLIERGRRRMGVDGRSGCQGARDVEGCATLLMFTGICARRGFALVPAVSRVSAQLAATFC